MLIWRVLMSAVILVPVLSVVWLEARHPLAGHPGGWLLVLGALVCLLGARDWITMWRHREESPSPGVVYLMSLLVLASAWVPVLFPQRLNGHAWDACLAAIALGLIAAFLTEISGYAARPRPVVRIAMALLASLFVAVPLTSLLHLRCQFRDAWGVVAVVSVVAVVKGSDIGAYFVGRSWGRNKLAPQLSPGKTVEGAWGGLLAGCVTSVLFFSCIVPWFMAAPCRGNVWQWAWYGAVLTAAGIIGDLSESLVKREVACKDSGTWLPGLGGILDILDSLTFAAPVAWWWWSLRPFDGA